MRIESNQFPQGTFWVFYPIFYSKEVTEEELKAMQENREEDKSSTEETA